MSRVTRYIITKSHFCIFLYFLYLSVHFQSMYKSHKKKKKKNKKKKKKHGKGIKNIYPLTCRYKTIDSHCCCHFYLCFANNSNKMSCINVIKLLKKNTHTHTQKKKHTKKTCNSSKKDSRHI